MTTAPVRTLYVGGTGRSGSTLLANLLGSAPTVASLGEVRFAWERGYVENRSCGCGQPVRSCPFWTEVVTRAVGGLPDPADAARRHAEVTAPTRMRTLPVWLTGRRPEGAAAAAAGMSRLLHEAAAVAGATVVVDSSKLPTHAALLGTAPDVDLWVVHLVRDPRATAWSWQRTHATRQVAGHDEPMDTFSPAKASLLWTTWNAALPRLVPTGRLLTVRYEDLMADPRSTVDRVLEHVGLPRGAVPFTDERTVDVTRSHTVAGNPGRLRHGPTRLRTDAEWRDAMPAADRRLVSVLTAPVRRGHGYR